MYDFFIPNKPKNPFRIYVDALIWYYPWIPLPGTQYSGFVGRLKQYEGGDINLKIALIEPVFPDKFALMSLETELSKLFYPASGGRQPIETLFPWYYDADGINTYQLRVPYQCMYDFDMFERNALLSKPQLQEHVRPMFMQNASTIERTLPKLDTSDLHKVFTFNFNYVPIGILDILVNQNKPVATLTMFDRMMVLVAKMLKVNFSTTLEKLVPEIKKHRTRGNLLLSQCEALQLLTPYEYMPAEQVLNKIIYTLGGFATSVPHTITKSELDNVSDEFKKFMIEWKIRSKPPVEIYYMYLYPRNYSMFSNFDSIRFMSLYPGFNEPTLQIFEAEYPLFDPAIDYQDLLRSQQVRPGGDKTTPMMVERKEPIDYIEID
jgi:hypothetical protein